MSDTNSLQEIIQDFSALISFIINVFKPIWNKLSKDKRKAIAPLRNAVEELIKEIEVHPKMLRKFIR